MIIPEKLVNRQISDYGKPKSIGRLFLPYFGNLEVGNRNLKIEEIVENNFRPFEVILRKW